MPINLPKKYDHKAIERKWQEYWQREKIYKWQNDKNKEETFVIDTPPPTVSGLLHMGHVFSYSQADFVARYQRMIGKDVFYPMGFDDNGLPTERLVEKVIKNKAAIYESENGAGSFVAKCKEVVEVAEEEFEALFNEIALSVDWDQKYQTISDESQKISQASFIDLYKKNLVEKKSEPVFWDIIDRTALAQADLVDKEVDGAMHDIIFKDELGDDIIIMTTRPELLPGCVALMIHPEDKKYQHLITKKLNADGEGFTGSYAITALFGVKVPIVADKLVKMDKGTGAVMCCTFGDETDIVWWRKHNLNLRVILGKDGRVDNDNLSQIFAQNKISNSCKDFDILNCEISKFCGDEDKGRAIKQAKEYVVNRLNEENLLVKYEPIKQVVKCAERSGAKIEILVQPQWFIKILDKKDQLKAKAQECNWYPEFMRIRIEQWIDGISWDWCISRQRFFGVKFPVWKVVDGDQEEIVVAGIDQLPVNPLIDPPAGFIDYKEVEGIDGVKCFEASKGGKKYLIYPETDIMDTWATSSISPQLSSHGISDQIYFNKERHQKLFPADLRPQAHEIIRSWAFYTIVKAMLHEEKAPWKSLMISGWCLAADKTKMSKSKGNVITPTALIEEKGSDVVRYWAANSHLGTDTAYSEDVFKIGYKLITKLFNAAKFASMNFDQLQDEDLSAKNLVDKNIIFEGYDLWILSRLKQVIESYQNQFGKFQYAKALEIIEDFFWNDFCDNYLEICKVRSYGVNAQIYQGKELSSQEKVKIEASQTSATKTLYLSLNSIIKLFAPFIPHICEELYSEIYLVQFAASKSIHARSNFPKLDDQFFDDSILQSANQSLKIIAEVRKWKSDQNISMKSEVTKIDIVSYLDLANLITDLKNVCNTNQIVINKGEKLQISIV